MASELQTAFILILIVLLASTETLASAGKCEKIQIPFCKQLGYNLTIFPNNLEHENQNDARIDASEFTSLVDSQCSKDMVYFLCSLYAPVCTMMAIAIPPCRSLCTRARNGCEDLMNNYGFRWPKRFACERFPKFGEDLCVGRNSSSSTGAASVENSPRLKNARRSGKMLNTGRLYETA